MRTNYQLYIIFILYKKEYKKLKASISIQEIKSEKIDHIRIEIVIQVSDRIQTPLASIFMIVICCGANLLHSLSLIHKQEESEFIHRKSTSVTKNGFV